MAGRIFGMIRHSEGNINCVVRERPRDSRAVVERYTGWEKFLGALEAEAHFASDCTEQDCDTVQCLAESVSAFLHDTQFIQTPVARLLVLIYPNTT